MENHFKTSDCPSEEIAAYIDGEIEHKREIELEAHFSACSLCQFELNEQKRFLRDLNASLNSEEHLELPANFTRLVVANAESSVNGLRRPNERFNAVFICVGLILFVLFALGGEVANLFSGIVNIFDRAGIVAGFFGHLVYSLFLGVIIVLRSIAAQASPDTVITLAMSVVIILSLTAASKRVLRTGRI